MPKITINGSQYEVEEGLNLIQVCDMYGIQIPRFCYHEKLPAVGSCRMCVVEVKGSRKLMPSCSTSISEGMEVVTESETIDNARRSMLEMFLANHPLDCPICDQGGECDLQDQTYRYGLDTSAIRLNKRSVVDKNFGPLIDAYMTRCIHCTRCVRFSVEVAGVQELGGIGRGDNTEINTYINKALSSELSGNLVDVCPVGALTNADYAYKARPWELISTETIDIMDAMGSNIKVDASPLAVLRINPRLNDAINETWLADKSRYIVDALRVQRLDYPMIKVDGKLQRCSWDEAFLAIQEQMEKVNSVNVAVLSGDFVDVETLFAMKELMHTLGVNNLDCRNTVMFNSQDRAGYLFNSTIAGIEESDACLIIGSNPRVEAPVLNARIRKRYLKGDFSVGIIGEKVDLHYQYDHLGDNLSVLQDILDGKHNFAKVLKNAKKPMLIIGLGAFIGNDYQDITKICKQIAEKYNFIQEDWNGYNTLQISTSLVGGLDIGFVPLDTTINANIIEDQIKTHQIKVVWLLNRDDINLENKDAFVIYQGHHGDYGATHADVVLPSALWLEQNGTYVNMEGRAQYSYKTVSKIGEAKEGWKIIRKFSEYLNKKLAYNTLEELREKLQKSYPIFASEYLVKAPFINSDDKKITNLDKKVKSIIDNYYITDIISKNSIKMSECTKLFSKKSNTTTIKE